MKNNHKLQIVIFTIVFLAGCSTFNGCDSFYRTVGKMTQGAAEKTINMVYLSKSLIDRIDNSTSNTISSEDSGAGDGWYICSIESQDDLYIRITRDEEYTDPKTTTGLEDISLIEMKLEDSSNYIELNWTAVSSTPTASGTLAYRGNGGDSTSDITGLTYDRWNYPDGGELDMECSTNSFLFGDYSLVLTFDDDGNGDCIIAMLAEQYGTMRLNPKKPYLDENAPYYDIEYVKDLVGELRYSDDGS